MVLALLYPQDVHISPSYRHLRYAAPGEELQAAGRGFRLQMKLKIVSET